MLDELRAIKNVVEIERPKYGSIDVALATTLDGFEVGEQVHLWLGTGELSSHKLSDIPPGYRKRRARLRQIIDGRVADHAATQWRDARYTACGRCDTCEEQVLASRDVLLDSGMHLTSSG